MKHERVAGEIVAGYVQSDDHNPPRYTKEQLVAEIAAKLKTEYGPVEEAVHDGLDMMIEINNHHGIPKLAEAVGWKVGPSTNNDPNAVHVYYPKGTPNYPYGGHAIINITACMAQLEAEYRKLAEQAQRVDDIFMRKNGHKPVRSGVSKDFSDASAELRAMAKEPTQLEKDVATLKERSVEDFAANSRVILHILDLLERKGKE